MSQQPENYSFITYGGHVPVKLEPRFDIGDCWTCEFPDFTTSEVDLPPTAQPPEKEVSQ